MSVHQIIWSPNIYNTITIHLSCWVHPLVTSLTYPPYLWESVIRFVSYKASFFKRLVGWAALQRGFKLALCMEAQRVPEA